MIYCCHDLRFYVFILRRTRIIDIFPQKNDHKIYDSFVIRRDSIFNLCFNNKSFYFFIVIPKID